MSLFHPDKAEDVRPKDMTVADMAELIYDFKANWDGIFPIDPDFFNERGLKFMSTSCMSTLETKLKLVGRPVTSETRQDWCLFVDGLVTALALAWHLKIEPPAEIVPKDMPPSEWDRKPAVPSITDGK